MKKALFTLFFMLLVCGVTAQDRILDQYKYVIVSSKFDFVKQVDGYQTSSLTKFLFEKMGFEVYLDNEELNDDLAMNRCSAIYANVRDNSSFLTTKSYIEIKDCKGRLLFTSLDGSSRLKQYVKAYRVSIKKAFESVQKIGYSYDPTLAQKNTVTQTRKKEEVKTVKKAELTKESKDVKSTKVKKEPVMVTTQVPVKTTEVQKEVKESAKAEVLYAQPNESGYQLVNTKPAIVFVLLKTSNPDKFIIKDKNGSFTKEGNYWLAEYYEKGQLVTQKYLVKF